LHTLENLQLQELKEEKALLEEEVSRLHEFLTDLNQRTEILSRENQSLKKLLGEATNPGSEHKSRDTIDLKHKIDLLQEDLQEVISQRDKLLLSVNDRRAEAEDLQGEIRTLKNLVRGLEAQIEQVNSGENTLALRSKKRLDELLAEVDKWKMRCGQADIERSKIAADLEECRAHVLDWQDKYIKTEASLQENKKLIDILEEKCRHEKEMQHNLRDQLEAYDKQIKDVSRREGVLEATEDRYRSLIQELTKSLENETRASNEKYSTLLESIKDKYNNTVQERDEQIVELKRKLTQSQIKIDRLDLDNTSLKDVQERFAGLMASQEEKENTIFELNKKVNELQVQNDILGRRIREIELKNLNNIQGTTVKDESYRKLEQELTKTKQNFDNTKQELNKYTETVKRKDRVIQQLEEEKRDALRRTVELNTMSNQEYLRDLQTKDGEILDERKKFREYKEETEKKLKQHEDLEEQLVSHSKQAIRSFEQRLLSLTEENENLKHKYRTLESMLH
jgi:chromosome segregation ATPase